MYKQLEVSGFKMNWVYLFADLSIGERIECDIKDRSKIASSISTNFHKPNKAKFITYKSKTDKNILYVERTE